MGEIPGYLIIKGKIIIFRLAKLAPVAIGLLLAAGVAAMSGSASAATRPVPGAARGGQTAQAAADARAKAVVTGCASPVHPPFFLTSKKNSLASSAKITKCTVPPPQECKLRVVVEMLNNFNGWIELPGGQTKGFTPKCLGLAVSTKLFKCKVTIAKHEFRTFEELNVEFEGSHGSAVKDSTVIHEFC